MLIEEYTRCLKTDRVNLTRSYLDKLSHIPYCLNIQLSSFHWLISKENPLPQYMIEGLKRRLTYLDDTQISLLIQSGISELINNYGYVESIDGNITLKVVDYQFHPPTNTVDYCKKHKDTYTARWSIVVKLINKLEKTENEQTVFLGYFPMMTDQGTFVVNGIERVLITQLTRSNGLYYTNDGSSDTYIGCRARIIPVRGIWIEFEYDKKGILTVRLDRKRKQLITVFLQALGIDRDRILKEFPESKIMQDTLDKDPVYTGEDAVKYLCSKLKLSEFFLSSYKENKAVEWFQSLCYSPSRYSLGKVGRYKINKKLGLSINLSEQSLHESDILNIIKYLIALIENNKLLSDDIKKRNVNIEFDDIDNFSNRRLRTTGELLQNELGSAFVKMMRTAKERMSLQSADVMTPQSLINIRPIVISLKEFFGTNQLSQYMDHTNQLTGLIHKRRFSALGPGGLSKDRAGFEVRDVHPSHYGRICPIETPDGPNIGLIGSIAVYARNDYFGFIETPYYKIVNKRVIKDKMYYLTADEEHNKIIASANTKIDDNGYLVESKILVRIRNGELDYVAPDLVDYIDVSTDQTVSIATAMIPFLEHNDANRALMGANMMRQAVPLMKPEKSFVGTGLEGIVAYDSGQLVIAKNSGTVDTVDSHFIKIINDNGNVDTYDLVKFDVSNQGTLLNHYSIVYKGDKVVKGQVLADNVATVDGELSLGANLLVAFMPYNGYNYEDSLIVSDRVVKDDVFSSVHIEEYEAEAKFTKLGMEKITREVPNIKKEHKNKLADNGIIKVGTSVVSGDVLVGKVTPTLVQELTPEEKLLKAIFGDKQDAFKDTSLRIPHGESGIVINTSMYYKNSINDVNQDILDLNEIQDDEEGTREYVVRVQIAQRRVITEGDKLAGRHGNKGVIGKIERASNMPFLDDGTPIDIILNPLSLPSRMNIGQILESHLGWIVKHGWNVDNMSGNEEWVNKMKKAGLGSMPPNSRVAVSIFDSLSPDDIENLLECVLPNKYGQKLVDKNGRATLYDGKSGEAYKQKISIGYLYILKLHHLVDTKIHARSIGPYSMITQQPLGGKAQFGGQRFGEMEVWALEGYGAANTLREFCTIKSDDIEGRLEAYKSIVHGEQIHNMYLPESFKVLIREMQSLCLNVQFVIKDGTRVNINDLT